VQREVADNKIFNAEDRIGIEELIGIVEDVRGQRHVAVGGHFEVHMRRPPGMPIRRREQHPDRTGRWVSGSGRAW
jgi:hypothetical protein